MKAAIVIVVVCLVLAGCASSEPISSPSGQGFNHARYVHPQTGDVKFCENTMGFFWWSGPVAYGECKSTLEKLGYQRQDAGTATVPSTHSSAQPPVSNAQSAQPPASTVQSAPSSVTKPQPTAPLVQVPTVLPDGSAAPTPVERTRLRLQKCGANPNSAYIREDGSWRIPGYGNDVELREIVRCMGGRMY